MLVSLLNGLVAEIMPENRVIELIEFLQSSPGRGRALVHGTEAFNRTCRHVLSLLEDSVRLFESESFASAAFFAITALEETAKAVFGIHIHTDSPSVTRKGPLYSHGKKHLLGAGRLPLELRARIVHALGRKDAQAVLEMARRGDLVRLREKALYAEFSSKGIEVPSDVISKQLSRSLLVFVLDTFDDSVVGYTKLSYSLGKQAEALFQRVVSTG